jgi:predicted nucleic acid-binding protein
MIVADTSVWIDFSRGSATPATTRLGDLLRSRDILVGDLILCELLQGARSERDANAIELKLRRQCELVAMSNANIAAEAAANRRYLRSKGITIRKTIDLIVGTFCIVHGHTLLHSDRDFEPMERHLGLKVVPTHYMVNEPMVAYG